MICVHYTNNETGWVELREDGTVNVLDFYPGKVGYIGDDSGNECHPLHEHAGCSSQPLRSERQDECR